MASLPRKGGERAQALRALGYSEREAEFLALVAVHSGYFLRRQYGASAQVGRGASSVRFLRRAVAAGHVRSTTFSNRTEVYHLFARPIYRAIGEEDNRNRRSRPVYSIKAKLMALDFVLAHRDSVFLATEAEKLEHFRGKLGCRARHMARGIRIRPAATSSRSTRSS